MIKNETSLGRQIVQQWFKNCFQTCIPGFYFLDLYNFVTSLGEISPLWHDVKKLWPFWKGFFSIWRKFQITLVNFICYYANFQSCKRPKIKQAIYESGHTAVFNRIKKQKNADDWIRTLYLITLTTTLLHFFYNRCSANRLSWYFVKVHAKIDSEKIFQATHHTLRCHPRKFPQRLST